MLLFTKSAHIMLLLEEKDYIFNKKRWQKLMEKRIYTYRSDNRYFELTKMSHQGCEKMKIEHSHSYYELYYLRRGYCDYMIDGKLYHLEKGDLVLIKPFALHKTIYPKAVNTHRNIIYFTDHFIQSNFIEDKKWLFELFDMGSPIIRCNERIKEEVESMFIDMHDQCIRRELGFEMYVEYCFHKLLMLLRKNGSEEALVMPKETNDIEKKILEVAVYIEKNYQEKINLEELAHHFFISQHYLSRKFKSILGMSITEYIQSRRIKAAQMMLKQSNKTILEIGMECGFGSNSQFRRVFNNYTGTSPMNYRKHEK